MSHIVKMETSMTDAELLAKAAARVPGAVVLGQGDHVLFSGQRAKGFGVKLPGWTYPAVVQQDGTVKFDNYGGHWGDAKHLKALVQGYGVEKTKAVLRLQGKIVTGEQRLANGTVRLRVRG